MAVAYFEKSEVRDLLSIARGRGLRIPQPSAEQLSDPEFILSIRRRFGHYPNDAIYGRAKRLAGHLGHTLSEAERMNRVACMRFITDNRDRQPTPPPSLDQIKLMNWLADLKGLTPPPECEDSRAAWGEFMQANITADDKERGYEAIVKLQKGGIEIASYGGQVRALALAIRLETLGAKAIEERIDEMLRGGEFPDQVALDLNVPTDMVYKRSAALEASGEPLPWY